MKKKGDVHVEQKRRLSESVGASDEEEPGCVLGREEICLRQELQKLLISMLKLT